MFGVDVRAAMSASEVNTKVAEAVTANEAGDFSTALTKLRSAKMLLIAMPDAKKGGDDGVELRWNREAIDSLIVQMQQQVGQTAGIRRTKFGHKRATD